MALVILRCIFLLIAAGVGVSIVRDDSMRGASDGFTMAVFAGVMALAIVVVVVDMLVPRKRIEIISTVYIGTLVGLFLAYAIGLALDPLLHDSTVQQSVTLVIGLLLCYTCISMLMQTKDDFRFIIPYVEFSKDVKGLKPLVLDTSVVIDGRIADVVETGVLDTQLVMPRFVLAELQGIADSGDKLRRSRGRRGLDILNRLRTNKSVDLRIHDRELPEFAGQPVDMKLVLLAKHLEGKIVTGDYNLNKVAKIHNVEVINLNDLANAVKPVLLPGENVQVRVVKAGEEAGQGVGYLDDGTMIVIDGGRDHISEEVRISVAIVLQTSAGRMIFGRYESTAGKA
ncbi:MAG: PIN/TRAM domain-containing protein [Planctomycetales bacterium]|nr:PIN/TRAM domain-containing protein [Planctomycetales bacterium]